MTWLIRNTCHINKRYFTDFIGNRQQRGTELDNFSEKCLFINMILNLFSLCSRFQTHQTDLHDIEIFLKVTLHARDAHTFNMKNEFLKIIAGVEVRTNKVYVNLFNYYTKNWLPCTTWIYSSDPFIRELNDGASLKLNDRGCVIFNLALEMFKKLESNMELHPDGVLERFKDTIQCVSGNRNKV